MIDGLSTRRFVMLSERYPTASVLALHYYSHAPTKFIHGGVGSWRNIVDVAVGLCGNDQRASRVVRPPSGRDESDDLLGHDKTRRFACCRRRDYLPQPQPRKMGKAHLCSLFTPIEPQ